MKARMQMKSIMLPAEASDVGNSYNVFEDSTDAPEIVHAFGKCVQITSRVESGVPPCTDH